MEVYNDGSKTQTSHTKVPSGYGGLLSRVCVERNLSLRWHRHVHEKVNELGTSATLRQSMRVIISEKLRVPGSIDGKEASFSPSVTPGDIPPLFGNDAHMAETQTISESRVNDKISNSKEKKTSITMSIGKLDRHLQHRSGKTRNGRRVGAHGIPHHLINGRDFGFPGRNSRKSTMECGQDTHSQDTSVQYTAAPHNQ